VAEACHLLEDFHSSSMRAVTAEDKELANLSVLHDLCDIRWWRVTTIAHKDAATLHVDVLNELRSQRNPSIVLAHSFSGVIKMYHTPKYAPTVP